MTSALSPESSIAKSVFRKADAAAASNGGEVAGVVVIFDSADGEWRLLPWRRCNSGEQATYRMKHSGSAAGAIPWKRFLLKGENSC